MLLFLLKVEKKFVEIKHSSYVFDDFRFRRRIEERGSRLNKETPIESSQILRVIPDVYWRTEKDHVEITELLIGNARI